MGYRGPYRLAPVVNGPRGSCAICKRPVLIGRILCEPCALPKSFKAKDVPVDPRYLVGFPKHFETAKRIIEARHEKPRGWIRQLFHSLRGTK